MSWWKYAKPGDKVVCVEAGAPNEFTDWILPISVGGIYTIAVIALVPNTRCGSGIALEETGEELGMCPEMFKPVQKGNTEKEVSKLRELLNTKKVPEDA